MENTTNIVTDKVLKRIESLNLKLKEQGLSQFSFGVNKYGYLAITEKSHEYNPTMAVLTKFDEEQALVWLDKHELFIPLYRPLMNYIGTDTYAKHITTSLAYPIGKWSDFNLANGNFQYRFDLLDGERVEVTLILNSDKDLSEVEVSEEDVEVITVHFPTTRKQRDLFHTTLTLKFETTVENLLSFLNLAEGQLLTLLN